MILMLTLPNTYLVKSPRYGIHFGKLDDLEDGNHGTFELYKTKVELGKRVEELRNQHGYTIFIHQFYIQYGENAEILVSPNWIQTATVQDIYISTFNYSESIRMADALIGINAELRQAIDLSQN